MARTGGWSAAVIPHLRFKVPTGGGKTLLAAMAWSAQGSGWKPDLQAALQI
jgi:hypothetical protein